MRILAKLQKSNAHRKQNLAFQLSNHHLFKPLDELINKSRHFTPILNQQQDLPHPQFPEIPTFSRNFLSMFGFFLQNREVLESLTGYNRHHDIFQP